MPALGDEPLHGVFIRAPVVTDVGAERRGPGPRSRRPADRRAPGPRAGDRLPPGADRRPAAAPAAGRADRDAGDDHRGRRRGARRAPHRSAGAGGRSRGGSTPRRTSYRRSLGVPAPSSRRGRGSACRPHPVVAAAALAIASIWWPRRTASWSGRAGRSRSRIATDWVIIELDAGDGPMAAEIRCALLQRARDGGSAAATWPASTRPARTCTRTWSCSGRLGFMAYAQEEICYRPPEPLQRRPARGCAVRSSARGRGRNGTHRAATIPASVGALRPAGSPDAWHLFDLWTPHDAARHRAGGGLRRRRLGGRRPRGGRAAQQPQPAPPLRVRRRLGDARRPARRRLRAARRLPRGAALPPLPGPRRGRRRSIPAGGAARAGAGGGRCGHPRSGANIRVGGPACRDRGRLRADRPGDAPGARGAGTRFASRRWCRPTDPHHRKEPRDHRDTPRDRPTTSTR